MGCIGGSVWHGVKGYRSAPMVSAFGFGFACLQAVFANTLTHSLAHSHTLSFAIVALVVVLVLRSCNSLPRPAPNFLLTTQRVRADFGFSEPGLEIQRVHHGHQIKSSHCWWYVGLIHAWHLISSWQQSASPHPAMMNHAPPLFFWVAVVAVVVFCWFGCHLTFLPLPLLSLRFLHTGNFGIWGAMFSSFDCSFAALRGKEDPWNAIASGFVTSGVLAARFGASTAFKSAVGGGVILACIEGLTAAINNWQTQQMKPQRPQIMDDPLGPAPAHS